MKASKACSRIVLVCWLALALASASILSACGNGSSVSAGTAYEEAKKDEDVIRAGVTSSLEAVFAGTDDEFLSHMFRNLTYDVTGIAVANEHAEAQIHIEHGDYHAALERAQEHMQRDDAPATVAELYHAGEDEELFSYLTQEFYRCLDETTDTVSCDASLRLTKQESEWSVDDKSMDELVDALLGT